MPTDYNALSNEWNLAIAPASWAFWIWAVIYPFLGLFTLYQALPEVVYSWAFDRNDDLIFNQISIMFVINIIALSAWQYIFLTNTTAGFIISTLDIFVVLATAISMLWLSLRATNNWLEVIVIRTGFSIYGGWLTAATILNISFVFKVCGLGGPNLPLSEEWFGVIIVWVAFAIYNLISYWERDPIYGAVYLWALGAIFAEVDAEKKSMTNLWLHSLIALSVHGASMIVLTAYLLFEWAEDSIFGWYSAPEFWDHGLFHDVTWAPAERKLTQLEETEEEIVW